MNLRSCSALAVALVLSLAACNSTPSEPPKQSGGTPAPPPPAVAEPAAAPAPPQPAAPQTRAPSTRSEASAKVAYAGELPPLPVTSFPAARPPEVVNAVYEFAARRPDVLRYVPCFCGCERNGHTHNADCFVAAREPDGKPRWDAHGMS